MMRTILVGALVLCLGSVSGARAHGHVDGSRVQRANRPLAAVPADAVIQLERTACLVGCPVYMVAITGRGLVSYVGTENVRVTGARTVRVDLSVVARLWAEVERIRFFDLEDRYVELKGPDGRAMRVYDLPTTIVTVSTTGRSKRVTDYVGAPDALHQLERDIDTATGSERWVFIDTEELEALVRSGWSATGNEGATMLREAIRRDAVAVARRLIDLGADPQGLWTHGAGSLSQARSGAMVELLVEAGANPNDRTGSRRTPLMQAAQKDSSVADALLEAGARIDDADDGKTALFFAACAGNWRVVTILLKAGANPSGSTFGQSALECVRDARAAEVRQPRLPRLEGDPTIEDFDHVIQLLDEAERRVKP